MNMFPKISFLAQFGKAKVAAAGDSLTAMIVQFDPKTATEAQIGEFESQLNDLTKRVAQLRAEYNKEKGESDAILGQYHQLLSAADVLKAQIDDPANAEKKASLEASLGNLLGQIEKMAADVDRQAKEAEEAHSFLEEMETAAADMANKLISARNAMEQAEHEMERAEVQKDRAKEHAEQAAVLAGIRTHNDTLGVALNAMQDQTKKSQQAADALNLKAKLLSGEAHKGLETDPNIAAALAVGAGVQPTQSLADRLAALKARK